MKRKTSKTKRFTVKIQNLAFGILMLFFANCGNAQDVPFQISLEPVTIEQLGGLQSYAFGQSDGKWLIVGGRLDGLHRRQPWASFDVAGHNNKLFVVDPVNKKVWTSPLTALSTGLQEQLSSTNMEFYQEGKYLYCLGGYGYSSTQGDHVTYDKLTAIDVPGVINAIVNSQSIVNHFRQITDAKLQVCGGRLRKVYGQYFLLGGQKFMGRYNPMGPDHGPGFIQEYTNAVRKFEINDNGTTLSVNHTGTYFDTVNLHRRDYNAESQIMPNGEQGVTMFSGVFQYGADLPFLNAVNVDSSAYAVKNSFQQLYNHYHCPAVPLYSEVDNEMYTIFFGGIAQYYKDNGILVQDDNVPFVKTIATVVRDANGDMQEIEMPVEMPVLLGAGAEFIPNLSIAHFSNDVIKMDLLTQDSVLLGYIFGGISSSDKNIFFTNDGTQSSATNKIFKVYYKKGGTNSIEDQDNFNKPVFGLMTYPNPNNGNFNVQFDLNQLDRVTISIFSTDGKLVRKQVFDNLKLGRNTVEMNIPKRLLSAVTYFVNLEIQGEDSKYTTKLILE